MGLLLSVMGSRVDARKVELVLLCRGLTLWWVGEVYFEACADVG